MIKIIRLRYSSFLNESWEKWPEKMSFSLLVLALYAYIFFKNHASVYIYINLFLYLVYYDILNIV